MIYLVNIIYDAIEEIYRGIINILRRVNSKKSFYNYNQRQIVIFEYIKK